MCVCVCEYVRKWMGDRCELEEIVTEIAILKTEKEKSTEMKREKRKINWKTSPDENREK